MKNAPLSPRPRVLIVDDEPLNLELLRQELDVLGYEIDEARSGEEALRRAGEQPPDVILLDIMMPGMDGFEVCRRLKASEATRDVPVIFMTALSEIADKITAFEAGGVDYVTKPFQVEEVLARVGTHVELRRTTLELVERNRAWIEAGVQIIGGCCGLGVEHIRALASLVKPEELGDGSRH